MEQTYQSFNHFVEKIVLHNKLVSVSRLKQAKAFLDKKSNLTLLDILVKAELLKARHAELILARFNKMKAEAEAAPVAQPRVDPNASVQKAKHAAPSQHAQENDPFRSSTQDAGSIVAPWDSNSDEETASEPKAASEPSKSKPDVRVKTVPSQQTDVPGGLTDLLGKAREQGASDLHIISGQPPVIRLNGKFKRLKDTPLSSDQAESLLTGLFSEEEKHFFHETQSLDTCYDIPGQGRYRTCIIRQSTGLDGSFRIIGDAVPSFHDLKLPEGIQRLTEYHQGLVLITGPAGMGKSTTLAAMVELINQSREEHIITLEDPIEYVFKPEKSQISQRAIGRHTQSFAAALRAALREDPDVILVGELRDQETASLAITAAETGHLVFATLHTNSASQTIIRLLDFFPPKQQNQIKAMISESIRGIVCQRLIPNQAGTDRVLALELMFNIPAIGNLIRDDKLYQLPNVIKLNNQLGMKLMEESIEELLKTGAIDPGEAHFAVVEQKLFQETQ